MINETLKIREENKAKRPSDIDIVRLNGYGWPTDKSRTIYYVVTIGPSAILEKI